MKSLPEIVDSLVAHGRSPETPVALIRWGTTNDQETVVGTLADIKQRASLLKPPVVIVIGEVVRLRDQLRWFDDLAAAVKPANVPRGRQPQIQP